MIEPGAIVHASSTVADDAYVGSFAIIGHPRRKVPRRTDALFEAWEKPVGSHIRSKAVVSAYCHIDDGTVVEPYAWVGSRCRIGHDTRVGEGAQLYYSCQVYDRVDIGPRAVVGGFVCNDAVIEAEAQVFGNLIHRLVDAPSTGTDPRPDESEEAPRVESAAVVGMGATVIGGVTVGVGAYIGAGAVLTGDAEAGTLYVGVPARPVGPAPRPFR